MAFTLQNDNGSAAGANAYAGVAAFKAYHDDRGRSDEYGAASDAQIEAAIVIATGYLDGRFQFIGWRQQLGTQTTQWPRYNAVDNDYAYVQGIPQEVKDAACEYALRALPGVVSTPTSSTLAPDPSVADTGALIEERIVKVGPIEEAMRFSGAGQYRLPPYPLADMILYKRGLVIRGSFMVRGA